MVIDRARPAQRPAGRRSLRFGWRRALSLLAQGLVPATAWATCPEAPCDEAVEPVDVVDVVDAGVVTGQVRERGTRRPVPGVTVGLDGRTAETDAQGTFRFLGVPPSDDWRVTVDGDEAVRFRLAAGESVTLALWVEPPPAFRREVVVRYRRTPEGSVVQRVDLAERRALPGSLDDPLRALSIEPGLARTPYDAGWLLVRGGDDTDTGIFLDGVRLPIAYHLGGYTSVLHPDLTEGVSFWPGVFPARYGDALSGAVDLVPTRAPTDATRLTGGVNIVFAQAAAQVPTSFGGVAVAARRSYLDGVLAAVLGAEAARIAPRFWDVQGQAHIGESSITAVALSDSIDAPSFDNQGIVTLRQQAAQLQAFVPVGALEIRPWLAATERGVEGEGTPQTLREWYPGVRVHLEDADRVRTTLGLEAERRSYAFERDGDAVQRTVWSAAPYAGLATEGPIGVWTEWRGRALLVDGRPPLTASMPRGGLRVQLGEHELYAAAGRLTATPAPTLFLAVADGAYLDLERSDSVEVGAELSWRGWRLQSAVWERWLAQKAMVELDGSIGPGGGRARGLEGKLGWAREGFEASVLGQWTDSRLWEDVPEEAFPSPLEQRTRLEVLVLQRLPKDWTMSSRFRATSGYPRPIVEGERTPTEAYDLLVQQLVPLGLDDDEARLRPYASLDVKVGRRFTFDHWRLTASLDVQNVTNRRVVEPVITGFGDTRPSYGFGLPILPVLSFDGEVFVR